MNTGIKEMSNIELFVHNFNKTSKTEFYFAVVRLIPVLLFDLITPVAIIVVILDADYLVTALLIVAEILFIYISSDISKKVKFYKTLNDSRIFKCINTPDRVTEIIVKPTEIKFEINGMEDKSIHLRDSDYRKKIIGLSGSLFGHDKIIFE